jgi:glycosyltransferase involved in cell wall biosynthesis
LREPDVGIVMPVYVQRRDYLELALRTILNQSYADFTLVVVIDGAPADIVEVVERETRGDPRVEILIKPQNEGAAKALNTGFERLSQIDSIEFLTWVSSDNSHASSFIERLRAALAEGPDEVGLSYSNFRCIDADGNVIEELKPGTRMGQPKEDLIDHFYIGCSFMYKKKYAALIAGYQMELVEEFEYFLRLTDHCDITYLPEELMDYRYHAPLGKSLEIDSSNRRRREWRHELNLARAEARQRRNIPPETTIVFPIDRDTPIVDAVESILERVWYENYRILIIDRGRQGELKAALDEIPDPRISIIPVRCNARKALRNVLRHVGTPFVFLYAHGCLPGGSPTAIADLRERHRVLDEEGVPHVLSTYYEEGRLVHRTAACKGEPLLGQFYRTAELKRILGLAP